MSHLLFRRFEPRSAPLRVTLLVVIPALLSLPVSHSSLWPYYTTLPLAFIAYGGGLVFFTLAYRLSPFHPLAKYPGPIIAKSSKWWAAYISFRGDLHRYYKHLHDRYGDIVRIGLGHPPCMTLPLTHLSPGPNELSIRDASLIHSVLGQGGLPKGPRAYHVICIVAGSPHVATRLGRADSDTTRSARSGKTHASTQALESSVLVSSFERVRSHCSQTYQATSKLSGELGQPIRSQGWHCIGHGRMVYVFLVRLHHDHHSHGSVLTPYFRTDLMGDMA